MLVLFIVASVTVGYFAGVASQHTVTSVSTTTTTRVTTVASNGVGSLNQCAFVTSCLAVNPSGLILVVSVNETSVWSNSSLTFDVSEFNPTASYINLSRSDNWYLESLSSAWPCNGGSTPYGVAVFRGYYTLQNVSSARDVLKFAPYSCVYNANATTFAVPPLSTFQPPYDFPPQIYAISGNSVNNGNLSAFVNSLGSSKPAVYTLAVGDEWGDLVLLHFSVVQLPSSH